MKQNVRISWLALVALTCTGFFWPALAAVVQKENDKEKVYEVRVGAGLKIDGKLAATDDKDKMMKGSYCKVYLVRMTKDKKYTIRMNSEKLDAVLRVENSAGKQLAFNDDAPGENTLNSRIDFSCENFGTYRIIATCLNGKATGDFTLLIKLAD